MTGTIVVVDLFAFILNYKKSHDGNTPTYREMCAGIGVRSTNTVYVYIQGMIEAGLLSVKDNKLCVEAGEWDYKEDFPTGEDGEWRTG